MLEHVERIYSTYSPDDIQEGMEIHLLLPRQQANAGRASYNLVINHVFCVASYVQEEVNHDRVHLLEPNRRMSSTVHIVVICP